MDVEFSNSHLQTIESDPNDRGGYSTAIARAFRKVMRVIRAAIDERDFRAMRSLNFEKLKGNRDHQHSLRLNDQFRLIVEIKASTPKNIVVVVDIEDYH